MKTQLIDFLTQSLREMLALKIVAKATLVLTAAALVATALRRWFAAGRHLAWCLDIVLLAGARASEYSTHLLEIVRQLRDRPATVLAATAMVLPSQLESRLIAILDPAQRRSGPGRKAATTALLAAIIAIVALATIRVGARAAGPAPSAREPIESGRTNDDPAAPMTVSGRVLDPAGKPVADAAVMVIVQAKQPLRPMFTRAMRPMIEFQGRSDGSGRFGIALPRTSSARHDLLVVTALAPGFGVGWTELDPDAEPPAGDVALRPEQVIRGQLFGVQGQPARGVEIRTTRLFQAVRGEILAAVQRPDFDEHPWRDLPAWPRPATSDDQGRFTLRGLGRGPTYTLFVDDPRYGPSTALIQTDPSADARGPFAAQAAIKLEPGNEPKPIAITLAPPRTVSGVVTEADTGRPVPHAAIMIGILRYEADGQGRFRAAVSGGGPGNNRSLVQAQSPDGPPYLIAEKDIEWPKGAVEQSVDLALKRGVVVVGKVIEEETGQPVPGANVRFAPYTLGRGPSYDVGVPAATGPDGSYRIAATPGPGNLVVQGPDDDYVLREFGADGGPVGARPGHERFYAHAYHALDLKPGAAEQEVSISLRRGIAVEGRAVDPEGRPIPNAWFFSRATVSSGPLSGWRLWRLRARDHLQVRDGRFVMHGLELDTELPAYFLEPGRKLGATARLSGKSAANGPVTVRLEPCGTARARLVTPGGEPLARYPAAGLVSMIITPGPPSRPDGNAPAGGPLFADEALVARLDPVNYPADFQSDAQGRVMFPALVPGAPYRIIDRTPTFGGRPLEVRKEFSVQPGEILELGDVVVASPRGRN